MLNVTVCEINEENTFFNEVFENYKCLVSRAPSILEFSVLQGDLLSHPCVVTWSAKGGA